MSSIISHFVFFILGLSLIARLGKDSATLTPSRLTNKFLAN